MSQVLALRKLPFCLETCAICFISLEPLGCTSSSTFGFLVLDLVVEALVFFYLASGGGVTCSSSDSASTTTGSCIFSFPFLEELVETDLAFLDLAGGGGVNSDSISSSDWVSEFDILLRATSSED